ncbi:TIGR03086 family metal-binding protein [Streptomyces sp. TS71-3]|uniref:TIGR03086 family metal-binding protein n=1 Tax=Streptomyces sp. TS71-3 TaxID=2733862 RepID=UPI001B2B7B81|nr:TIGR03086 family metal-binding protein [Streptomyces sp. TS71-3]GHJ34799.1 TIGR03086 family protein [Streptomyces sp. TS71-3]
MNDMHPHAGDTAPSGAGGSTAGRTAGNGSAPPVGELLDLAARRAVPVVRAIPGDLLTAPTPCSDYDVRALLNHLFHVVVQFRGLAEKQNADFDLVPDYVAEGDDWRERFAAATERLVAAWSEPGAEEGTTGTMDMPARTVGCMALLDLTVHVWDLARATGQEYRIGAAEVPVLRVLDESVTQMGPVARRMGLFAAPVRLPDGGAGGDGFSRLLAETGRDPLWAPRGT